MTKYESIIKPIMDHFRAKRMAQFVGLFDLNNDQSVIDVGGRGSTWENLTAKPRVTLVNIEENRSTETDRMKFEQGNGCDLRYKTGEFDIAHSNSVIEHVGSWDDQQAFASEIRRVARSYYVQTPYKHFPIEPHVLAPFIQYLPKPVAKWAVQKATPHAFLQHPSKEWASFFVDTTRLLTVREMKRLFPDAVIVREKFMGLTKSLIAYRLAET